MNGLREILRDLKMLAVLMTRAPGRYIFPSFFGMTERRTFDRAEGESAAIGNHVPFRVTYFSI